MPTIADYRNKFPSLRDLDDAALIDRVAQVQGVPREDVIAHMGYKPKSRGILSVLNDTVIEGANAVAGGVGSVANFVAPGNPVSEFIDENFIKAGEAKQSDVVKAEKAAYRADMDAAEGIGDEIGATLGYVARNPLQSLAQAAGSFVLPGAAVKGGGMLASMAGAGAKGATRAGLAGGAAAGAALSGGDAAGTAYELVKKAGGTDEQAEAAAREASVLPAAIGAAGGLVGAERLVAGAKGFGGGALSRALKTAGVEGVQEAVEEGVTQYEGQAAAAPYDPTIDPMKGVAGAATMGAVLGGATGGAVSLLSGEPAKEAKPDPVLKVLAAPSVDAAIQAATEGLTGAKKPAPAELPQMDAEDRREVLGLMQVVNRPGVSPNVARFAQARMDALLAPYRSIPTGEATEMLPVPDVRELTDEERAEYANAVPFSYRRALERGLPQPEVTELLPTGDATEVEPIPAGDAFEDIPAPEAYETLPTGEASDLIPTADATEFEAVPAGDAAELDVETIQPTDLMAKDGEPFTSKTGAQAKAYASGGGKVVAIPNHFGSGVPGYVVRPLMPGRPSNTRGTDARDLPRSSNVNQPDVPGTAGQPVADGAGRPDAAVGGQLAAGRVASDATGQQPGTAAAVAPSSAGNAPVGAGNAPDAALTGAASELVKVRTVFGTNAYVRSSDLAGDDNGLVRMFTADGKNNGRIARGNLDQTGEKRAAAAKENADNPMFNVITRKGGGTFADQASAARELSMRGMGETHEVVPASEISPSATGYAIRKKPEGAAPTFTEGQRVTLSGTPYTVTSANNTAVKLQGADGITKMVARNSKTFGQIQAEAEPKAAPSDDYLKELFGASSAEVDADPFAVLQREADKGAAAQKADTKRIRDALATERQRAQREHDEWAGKVYKANKTQVDLRGDGPSNQASMSIGAINESRRRNAMEALSQELKALDKLERGIADDAGAAQFMSAMRALYERAEKIAAGGNGLFKTPGEQFQYMLLDDLKFRGPAGRGNVTSNGLSKAVLAAIKPAATPNAEKPVQPASGASPAGPAVSAPSREVSASDPMKRLGAVMQRAGWEIDYIDLDLTGDKPKAEIKITGSEGRWLWAKVDSLGRASFETFQREGGLARQANLKAGSRAPLVPRNDDTFLGRQKFEGARSMLRGLVTYLADNATNPVALADMKAAWAGVMSGPVNNTQALPAPEAAPAPAPEAERTPKAQAVKEALAAKKGAQSAPVATHKDPGEPAEPVTPAVVREAIKTGVQATDRKPSAMKAELLREIDRAVEDAPDYGDFQAAVKSMGLKDATAVFTDKGTLGEKYAPKGYSRPTRTFKVEGDGVFTVQNTVRQLLSFREKVEKSPGFRDRQAPGGLNERATDALDRRSTDAAIANMVDEGDFQAALDFAEAKGVDIANVKLTKVLRDRLEKWQRDTEMAAKVAEFESRKPTDGPAPGSLAAAFAEKDAAPPADAAPDAEPAAGIASQTFDQWVRAAYAANEYAPRYLEEFEGNENRAILGAAAHTIDNDRTTPDLLKAAKQEYRSKLFSLPREASIDLSVWDDLDNALKVEAQRHFYDLDSRITRRDQDTYAAKAKAEREKKAPYEAAFAEVDAEIRRLDKIPGPMTQKQKDLSARRERLREALYQIGQGKEPDGRLLRKEAEPAAPTPAAQAPAGRDEQPEAQALTLEAIPKTLQITLEVEAEGGKVQKKVVGARRAYLAAQQRVQKLQALKECVG